jgi:hypothetical protein
MLSSPGRDLVEAETVSQSSVGMHERLLLADLVDGASKVGPRKVRADLLQTKDQLW